MHMTIAITMPEHIEAHPADVLKSIAEAIRKPTAPQAAACKNELSAISEEPPHTFRFRLGQMVTLQSAFLGPIKASVECRSQHREGPDSYGVKWQTKHDPSPVYGTFNDEALSPA